MAEFEALSFKSFYTISKAYNNKCQRALQLSWEQTRNLMWTNLLPHQKKGSNLKPQDVLQFTWEQENKQVLTPQEQQQQLLEAKAFWDKVDSKKDGEVEQ